MKTYLSSVAASRDNNFNLLRFCAATGVFISHTFLLSGMGFKSAAVVLGYVCVNVFFIISGFLVTKSLIDRARISSFVLSRVLRIFPALIAAVLFSTVVVGLAFTELPKAEFLTSNNTHEYLLKNILLIIPGIPETLPGVFLNAANAIVNAPLWTLPYEIKMYILLGILGGLILYRHSESAKTLFTIVFGFITIVSMILYVTRYSLRADPIDLGIDYDYFRFSAMFGSGVLLYMLKEYIYLSGKIFFLLVCAILLSSFYRPLFVTVTYSSLCYLVIVLAYLPNGFIRKFNKLGDYSYGIYIYGYPVQQSIEQVWPDLHLLTYFAVTFGCTLLLSICSWHLLEKRMLRLKTKSKPLKAVAG